LNFEYLIEKCENLFNTQLNGIKDKIKVITPYYIKNYSEDCIFASPLMTCTQNKFKFIGKLINACTLIAWANYVLALSYPHFSISMRTSFHGILFSISEIKIEYASHIRYGFTALINTW
jgi:hypothetical protein